MEISTHYLSLEAITAVEHHQALRGIFTYVQGKIGTNNTVKNRKERTKIFT